MDSAEELFAQRGIRYSSIRGDQTPKTRERNIEAFVNDPDVAVAVCSLTVAGVGLNLQVASDLVLAELSWTDAEQTQAIDRVHRIGQVQPVTAWRIIAAQTIDSKVAELIDNKAGLAARALDGSQAEPSAAADVQLEALVALLTDALSEQLLEPAKARRACCGGRPVPPGNAQVAEDRGQWAAEGEPPRTNADGSARHLPAAADSREDWRDPAPCGPLCRRLLT